MSRSPSAETRCDRPATRTPVTNTGGASAAFSETSRARPPVMPIHSTP